VVRVADHLFISSVVIKNESSFTSTVPIRLHGVLLRHRESFTLCQFGELIARENVDTMNVPPVYVLSCDIAVFLRTDGHADTWRDHLQKLMNLRK